MGKLALVLLVFIGMSWVSIMGSTEIESESPPTFDLTSSSTGVQEMDDQEKEEDADNMEFSPRSASLTGGRKGRSSCGGKKKCRKGHTCRKSCWSRCIKRKPARADVPLPPAICPDEFNKGQVIKDGETTVLGLLNGVRKLVTTEGQEEIKDGDDGPIPQGDAAKMKDLSWDAGLAGKAQSWANLCSAAWNFPLNATKDTAGFQNLMIYTTNAEPDSEQDWNSAIENIKKDGNGKISKDLMYTAKDNPYLMRNSNRLILIIWQSNTKVGCGFSAYRNKNKEGVLSDKDSQVYVCYFEDGGLKDGEQIYEEFDA